MQTMDTLSGLYEQVAAGVARRRAGFGAPVTVAEIYQELVPYRSVRDSVGFAMNADYEHVLLRLLSGEGDYARLEPQAAAEAMRRELRTPNPNVSMYREYAACDVWIAEPAASSGSPAASGPSSHGAGATEATDPDDDIFEWDAGGDDDVSSEAEGARVVATIRPEHDERAAGDAVPAGGSDMRNGSEPAGSPADGMPETPAAPTRKGPAVVMDVQGACVFCDSSLPQGRQVLFCPYCGGDQSKRPCGACGEVLEADWIYCIACGGSTGPAR